MTSSRLILLFVLFLIFPVACTPLVSETVNSLPEGIAQSTSFPFPVDTPVVETLTGSTLSPTLEPEPTDLPISVSKILGLLSEQLNVAAGDVTVLSFEQVQWPDGCLGAAQPDEMCTQAVVDGYQIILQANGQTREFHTNIDGSLVREVLLPSPKGQDVMIRTVQLARQFLAYELAIGLEDVELIRAKAVDWPNNCLGLVKPDQVCAQVITPGYQIIFLARGNRYEVRTDRTGEVMRVAQNVTPEANAEVILTWNRRGGIAGLCNDLFIYSNGWALARNCRENEQDSSRNYQLTALQLDKIFTWQEKYSSFEVNLKDPAVADAMAVNLIFNGHGKDTALPGQQQEILLFVQDIFASAMK